MLFQHNNTFFIYYSAVERRYWQYIFYTDMIESKDLVHWSSPVRLFSSNAGYSAPGNILRIGEKWVMCLQTYPIDRFQDYGSKNCRLWLSESEDLRYWSAPRIMKPEGSTAVWTKQTRQIDPFLVEKDGKYWCYYKSSGRIGLMVSDDLQTWREHPSNHPIIEPSMLPDHPTVENIWIFPDEHAKKFLMFFSPCYIKRGIGVATSSDLLNWTFLHYLDFPKLPWAESGPTAPSIIDCRELTGNWIMAFHGEHKRPHDASLGLAWSSDLVHWTTPY